MLVNGNTAAVLGIAYTYVAARFAYGFLYGMFGRLRHRGRAVHRVLLRPSWASSSWAHSAASRAAGTCSHPPPRGRTRRCRSGSAPSSSGGRSSAGVAWKEEGEAKNKK